MKIIKVENCGECPYFVQSYVKEWKYYCDHEDFEELEQVRQVPRKVQDPDIPEWCPLEDEKEAP